MFNLSQYISQMREIPILSRNQATCAGGLIYDISTNRILVVKGPVKWSLPKGHLEPGESTNEGAMREIFEETSLIVDIKPNHLSRKIRKNIYYLFILDNCNELNLTPLDQAEITDIKWCTHSELINMNCNKQLNQFLSQWHSMIRIFYDNREKITVLGSVPTDEEKSILIETFRKNQTIYGPTRRENSEDDENP
jgi:ADP-ribose pyrophosphatase YjhB (NUDIX family)